VPAHLRCVHKEGAALLITILLNPRFLLFSFLLTYNYLFRITDGAMTPNNMERTYYKYTTVTGYFLQDEPSTDPETFDYNSTSLGLIDRAYDSDSPVQDRNLSQWQRFANQLQGLNQEAPSGTRYVLLYMARHGDGWHNRAERIYGSKQWNCYWSTLDGDGKIFWDDAHLTEEGISQALAVNAFWKREIAEQSIPTPQKYFVSPLERCLQTAQLTWSDVSLPSEYPFKPEVKEFLRECIGIHTCDRRSNKTHIQSNYSYQIEPGFAEEDPLWLPGLREPDSVMTVRLKRFLDELFKLHKDTIYSLTSHSAAADAMLRAVGHRRFPLKTGTVIPVLIKAELLRGEEPDMPIDPWYPKPEC
jgi:broad specificity phosphatase PhoE